MRSPPCLVALAAALLLSAFGAPRAVAARRDWSGSAACGACHPQELAAWRQTAHARPFPTTAALARCLGCHTTGEAPAGELVEAVVGCEACHGAGADYGHDDLMRNRRLALDLGLVDLRAPAVRAATCATCHTEWTTSGRVLDLRAAAHPSPPRAP